MLTKLSIHFNLEELLESQTARANFINEQFSPLPEIISNLTILAEKVLDAVRDLMGVEVDVSSGYRCLALNTRVGGEPTSQHLTGKAADINAKGIPTEALYQKIKASKIEFDQLIIEHNSAGVVWVHISYDPAKVVQRCECMRGEKIDGGYTIAKFDGWGAFKAAA